MPGGADGNPPGDWPAGSWEGARREELRRWRRMSLRERLLALEEMAARSRFFARPRRERGLPVIDPRERSP